MSRHTLKTIIEDDVEGVPITLHFEREPYVPAQTSGPVEACHPEEGGGIVDITIEADWDAWPVYLRAALEEEMHAKADDDEEGWREDAADYQRRQRLEG